MKRTVALIPLIPLLAIGLATAGQPLHHVLKLRAIEVVRCEVVTAESVAVVSSYVRAKSLPDEDHRQIAEEVAGRVPGVLVEAIVRRQRDVAFPIFSSRKPIRIPAWAGSDSPEPLNFFVPTNQPDACVIFVPGQRVNVVLSQKAECDTYPPAGICAFDLPIRVVDSKTWMKYGE